jgi:anaerobic ribonucleoside-triphosphate reductase activating protein
VETVKISGILPCSFVNGDGARYVVFVQGCSHHCDGCHNPETWDFDGGTEITPEELAADFKKRRLLDGITLSGGDPFFQEKECISLIDLLPGVNVWVYTGFEYDEIKNTELAKMANVLVTGKFIQELACDGKMYGSTNQKIIRRKNEN